MKRLALLALLAWAPEPPQPYAHMPDSHRPLPRTEPHYPQVPMGPAQGSIEPCLQLQARGGLSC